MSQKADKDRLRLCPDCHGNVVRPMADGYEVRDELWDIGNGEQPSMMRCAYAEDGTLRKNCWHSLRWS